MRIRNVLVVLAGGVRVPCQAVLFFLILFPCVSHTQDRRSVRGIITEAEGHPVAGATIEALSTYWTSQSRLNGEFEIALPAGTWHLRFSKVGYRPDTVRVRVPEARPPERILARLERAPIELGGLTVAASRTIPLAQTVTTETVRQVPPLGEPDVFRSIILLPGVSQPNDLKGRIHLAGGASDETGVFLDDHPLQDPFHLLGLFGAFNVAALDHADVLIHHLPLSMDGRLSGIIDLETRRPEPEARHEAVASLLTGGVTMVQPEAALGMDLLATGRITYLDKMAGVLRPDIPQMGFSDGVVRIGRSWRGGFRAEAIAFATRDVFRDPVLNGSSEYEPLRWGESLMGARISRSGASWRLSARASFNHAFVSLDERPAGRSNFLKTGRDWGSLGVELGRLGERWQALAGGSLDHRLNEQRWSARGIIDEIFSPSTPSAYAGAQTQTTSAIWGEASTRFSGRWQSAVGGRLWLAGGRPYLAPRGQVSFRATDRLNMHAALNRRYQFDAQLEEPIEGSVTAPVFLISEPRRADVAALSAHWQPAWSPFGASGSVQVQAFRKQYPDRPILAALEPGQTRDDLTEFPRFDRIPGSSVGAMVGWRFGFPGDGIVQGGYTYQRVRETVDGFSHPTAWDAPHNLSVFAGVPVWRRWNLNVVYQAHSGRATTPVLARILEPSTGDFSELRVRYLRGARNSIRVPSYHRLDLGARRTWTGNGADWTLFMQVLNVLAHENAIDYNWTEYYGRLAGSSKVTTGRPGLPILPSLGLEVRW